GPAQGRDPPAIRHRGLAARRHRRQHRPGPRRGARVRHQPRGPHLDAAEFSRTGAAARAYLRRGAAESRHLARARADVYARCPAARQSRGEAAGRRRLAPHMRPAGILVFAALGVLAANVVAQDKVEDIIAASDRVRNPDQPFRSTNTLVEYVKGQPRNRVVLVVYAREDKTTRQFGNLVRYVDPPRDTGKMVLFNG